jgi:hypothetical protein
MPTEEMMKNPHQMLEQHFAMQGGIEGIRNNVQI